MAGSWDHITNEVGAYTGAGLLENGGDVEEFAREAYGMVWYLAMALASAELPPRATFKVKAAKAALHVGEAAANYADGFAVSPTNAGASQ